MKKERQIGVRVGLPAFFALELEDVYRHKEGVHRALAFPDFVGLLVGMGLEAYRKTNALPSTKEPDGFEAEEREREPLNLFNISPEALPGMFRDFEEVTEQRERDLRIRLVPSGSTT